MNLSSPPEIRPEPILQKAVGQLDLQVYASRAEMGAASAADVADEMIARLAQQSRLRIIFAAAPSQSDMLDRLIAHPGIDWSRCELFHMDEFIGLPPSASQRFAHWLDRALFDRVPQATIHRIIPEPDPEQAAQDYAAALDAAPIDIVCLGIGVNGHIAFNDPPVADFHDPLDVKIVELDRACRLQQVDDQGFAGLAAVPTHAVTLTIPRLLRAERLFCVVPGAHKAPAVTAALKGPQSTDCPASILRDHPGCTLYLDQEAAADV